MSSGSNKFGTHFQWTTFGESHGPAMGVVIDGCPAGVPFDEQLLLENLAARKPGQNQSVSDRQEADQPELLSGVYKGQTLGTPIAVIIANTNQRSGDYDKIKQQPRIGHADDLWQGKFEHWDHRGGGRASARETVNWVVAGSFAQMFCQQQWQELSIQARLLSLGGDAIDKRHEGWIDEQLLQAKKDGESLGAVLQVRLSSPPPFLGEPVFKKIKSQLAGAYMTINACVGVELGAGFSMARAKGTKVHTEADSPQYGGIRGGLTTGEDIVFQLAFKPTSSILDVAKMGRHDPCVAIRALPVVEAMSWAVIADQILARRLNNCSQPKE